MGIPALLATFAACGSIVTSIKSGWELRRMVRRKVEAKECEEEAPYVFRRLRLAYSDGLMSVQEYELWYERFLVAKVEKDLAAMRRIRAHLRVLENGAPVTPSQRSRDFERTRRRHSISFESSPYNVGWRDLKETIDYRQHRSSQVGARPEEFIRMDQQTHSRSSSSDSSSRSCSDRSSQACKGYRKWIDSEWPDYDSNNESSNYYDEKKSRRRGRAPR